MAHPYFRSVAIFVLSSCATAGVSTSLQAQPYNEQHSRVQRDEPRRDARRTIHGPTTDNHHADQQNQHEHSHGHGNRAGQKGQQDLFRKNSSRNHIEHARDTGRAHSGAHRVTSHRPQQVPAWRDGPPIHAGPAPWHMPDPSPRFQRGGLLPAPYAGPGYYVAHPRHHGLRPPPHGQRWVRIGADYLLITIATGLIIDLVIHPR